MLLKTRLKTSFFKEIFKNGLYTLTLGLVRESLFEPSGDSKSYYVDLTSCEDC